MFCSNKYKNLLADQRRKYVGWKMQQNVSVSLNFLLGPKNTSGTEMDDVVSILVFVSFKFYVTLIYSSLVDTWSQRRL